MTSSMSSRSWLMNWRASFKVLGSKSWRLFSCTSIDESAWRAPVRRLMRLTYQKYATTSTSRPTAMINKDAEDMKAWLLPDGTRPRTIDTSVYVGIFWQRNIAAKYKHT